MRLRVFARVCRSMRLGHTLRNRQRMALADIPNGERSKRLDSWKEIAEYLRRDVRTAARWESQGLPLHRVPGGKGRSVYALAGEIDAWLASQPSDSLTGIDLSVPVDAVSIKAPADSAPPARSGRRFNYLTIGVVCGFALVGISVSAVVRGAAKPMDFATAQATVTSLAITIADGSGASRVVHRFDPAVQPMLPRRAETLLTDVDADGSPEILAGVSYYLGDRDRSVHSGELFSLTASGRVRTRFVVDDALTFTDGAYSGPWVVSDWQLEPATSRGRVAVSAHDFTWWASIVAMFDHTGQRVASFVNPGWVESLVWLDRERLAVAGFNNERNEAMLAVLDPAHMAGQAPGTGGTAFACPACASSPPLLYATFARSELNQLTGERFNRARVSAIGNQIVVITSETSRERTDITGIYEFDRDLRFVRARYSDPYWDEHRRLELAGRITHSRDACPDRDGPRAVQIWDAARGWTRTTPVAVRQ